MKFFSKKPTDTRSTFCSLPWIHLATHPHGQVSLCCESDHSNAQNMARNFCENKEDHFLELNRDSVESIRNSEYFREVRQQFLKGAVPKACRNCFDRESRGLESQRTLENRVYHEFTEEKARGLTQEDGSINLDLQFLELRLGNLCNLKCRMCNPYSSSKWRKEYEGLAKELPWVREYKGVPNTNWTEREEFWQELLQHADSLEHIYINGGEPTLIKRHWRLLEELVEQGKAEKIVLIYSLNMTHIPDIAFPLWKQFKNVEIRASIDDLRERNYYIRYPTKWEDVEKSLDRLLSAGVETNILQTVGAMNFYYLDEFHGWAQSRGLRVSHNFVEDPEFLGPRALPLLLRQEILDRFSKTLPKHLSAPLVSLFGAGEYPELEEKFNSYTQTLDRFRNEDFTGIFPEVASWTNRTPVPAPTPSEISNIHQ